jgi:hypothetical protein
MTSHHSFLFVDQWPVMVAEGTRSGLDSQDENSAPAR